MNDKNTPPNDDLLRYQTRRFQELMQATLQCCEMRMEYLAAKFNVPQAELRCLMLFQGEKYLTVKGMSQKLDVAKSRVTKILEGLLQKKLVESIDDPKDARVKLISLTPAGQKRSDEIGAFSGDLHQKLLLELDQEERKHVLASLELLRAGMEAIKKEMV
jgi:DNA-binding MarR family transcriptional regulator